MILQENVPLAPFTTFRIGGRARVFVEALTHEDILIALASAHEHDLPLYVLGAGSNVLIPDDGIEGVVLRVLLRDISFQDDVCSELLIAGAGLLWEDAVSAASERGLFGIENLAGIPGTMGGAAVQNIGAYGAELKDVFEYADVIDSTSGEARRIMRDEAEFEYRSSFFKKHRELIVVRVALSLKKQSHPNTTYADIARAQASGTPLVTPIDVVRVVRAIRAGKFPDLSKEGTAGSFFKNPLLSSEHAEKLGEQFSGLPMFPQADGRVKVSLAWILDHVLSLKGYARSHVRLYENQPLVVVAHFGARAAEVDALASEVSERVFEATGITIEREVETFGVQK